MGNGTANTTHASTSSDDDSSPETDLHADTRLDDTRAIPSGYQTGFCGLTRINHIAVTYPETFHRSCPGTITTGSPARHVRCACECHDGIPIWEDRDALFTAAIHGHRAPAGAKQPRGNTDSARRRSRARADSPDPETLEEARAADRKSPEKS